jgi:hypothetical protein
MTEAGAEFRLKQNNLTINLYETIEAYAKKVDLPFDRKALGQMEHSLSETSADVLMFGFNQWPICEDARPSRLLICAAGILLTAFTSVMATTRIAERNPNHTLSSISTHAQKCGEHQLQRA